VIIAEKATRSKQPGLITKPAHNKNRHILKETGARLVTKLVLLDFLLEILGDINI
jgi:hypothetical protein